MEEDESDYCICYYADQNTKSISIGLLTFGYENFMKAVHIAEINQLQKIIEYPQFENKELLIKKLQPFIFENLLDAIKISICFENYMKAKLLLNGFVIHKISDKPFYAKLKKEQAKRPIELREVYNLGAWEKFGGTDHYYLPGLRKQTISINTILNNQAYQKFINLPSKVQEVVSKVNKQRNRLHFLIGEFGSYGKSKINELKNLIEFVDSDLRILQNALIDEMELPSDKKIKKAIRQQEL